MIIKKKVFIPFANSELIKMFADHGNEYEMVYTSSEADIIIFHGVDDTVHPLLYREQKHYHFPTDILLDESEATIFYNHLYNKTLVGIGRGAQLLNVLAGGGLSQDKSNHVQDGGWPILHVALDRISHTMVHVNSFHNQVMIPGMGSKIMMDGVNLLNNEQITQSIPECVVYPNIHTFCYQPHPERIVKSNFDDKSEVMFFEHLSYFME